MTTLITKRLCCLLLIGLLFMGSHLQGETNESRLKDSGQVHRGDIFVADIETVQGQYDSAHSTFLVKKRSSVLKRNNCQTCHNNQSVVTSNPTKTHGEISLAHAVQQGMTCQTCHNVGQVELLKNVNNDAKIEIDHAYLSCQGCHFSQTRDWAGGAHGKRVRIWAEPRIIYNCTECHNPHSPALSKRWPKILSTLPEKK